MDYYKNTSIFLYLLEHINNYLYYPVALFIKNNLVFVPLYKQISNCDHLQKKK